MKILLSRNVVYQSNFGQRLFFDDGTQEFDSDCSQTTAILTAELYNGKAAKDDDGQWVPAPGPRKHEMEFDILGFHVGLTLVKFDSNGKAVHDYTVITPTGVAFHGDGKDNTLHTPSNWTDERVAAEIISWICLGEDSGATPLAQDDYQWTWVRSVNREMADYEIRELIEAHDRGKSIKQKEDHMSTLANDVQEAKEAEIEARARDYQERCIHANQSGLVTHLLSEDSNYLSYDDITNLTPDTASMDGYALSEFISDELGEDWKTLIDVDDYIDEDEGQLGKSAALADLNPLDLNSWDIEMLRDYIAENHTPREIFEWYLVDSFLATELDALGHPTLTDGHNHWWGRRTTGQAILMDGVLQAIAAKYI